VPELPDVEGYRRTFERRARGKRVRAVHGIDVSMLRNTSPQGLSRALRGKRFARPERQGKLLICPADGVALVLHFGMTGTFVWSTNGPRHNHDRMTLAFDDGELRYRNMRKFGGIWLAHDQRELEQIRGRLGPDWQSVSRKQFDELLARRKASLKALLMNQALASGLGNLTADESLWQARIDPRRRASSLDSSERRVLYQKIQKVLRDSIPYGLVPSKRTWLTGARDRRDGTCPRCGARLERETIAGRTTVFCPVEQR
jgi:formamidopyrimidine-DNA glycosylase